jgi:chromosome partitioning protein
MKTIAFLNQKGGVGKTSSCVHLAGALAATGLRILLVDADPQASLSRGFWGPDAVEALEPEGTIAELFAGNLPHPSKIIRGSGLEGIAIDIVPGAKAARLFNVPDPEMEPADRQSCIREFLAECRDDYDLCLIDCPPNLHLCSYAALVAADGIVVPLQPEDYGSQGIRDVTESIDLVKAGPNPDLVLVGYLLTMTAKEAIHTTFEGILRAQHGDDVFAATVPRLAGLKEATAARRPAAQYKPKAAPAKAVRLVADELLARVAGRLETANLGVTDEQG